MKRIFNIAIMLMMVAMSLPVLADKPFYDSKSWIVNVAGDADFLINNGFESKVHKITNLNIPFELKSVKPSKKECEELAEKMTKAGIGKKFIDALTGNGKDDTYLKQLALANANRADMEYASNHLRGEGEEGMKNLVKEDYEPILCQNYIVLVHRECTVLDGGATVCRNGFAIFQVMVSKQEAFDIVMNFKEDKYSQLKFPIKFLYANKFYDADIEKIIRDISQNVPGLAIRGVITRRHPARISLGAKDGIKKGDVVSIYSQREDKNGIPYSKRISRARVCGLWDDESQVNFEAGTAGNSKNSDIVVRTPLSDIRLGLMATYTPRIWGGQFVVDIHCGNTRAGLIHHFLWELIGFSMTDSKSKFMVVKGDKSGHEYRSPLFFNSGIGYGMSKTFLGFFDVMPFFLCQFEGIRMNDTAGEDDRKSMYTNTFRFPVGVRFSFNIGYPHRLAIEAGYSPTIGIGKNYKLIKQTCDIIGAKRNGLFVNLGIIF